MKISAKNKIVLVVMGILIMLMFIFTLSYSYFTARLAEGNETTAEVKTATLGRISFVTTSPSANIQDILPGWTGEGSTSVYFVSDSDEDVDYYCTISLVEGSYSNNLYVKTISGSDAQVETETVLSTTPITISSGTLEKQSGIVAPATGEKHEVTYQVIFKEIGQKQNEDQGKTINTYTTCYINSESTRSALTLVSGTMTDTNGDPIANQAMVAFSSPTYFTTDQNGHYEVRLYPGEHNIYYVPGMSMEALTLAGKSIQNNENAVSKTITVSDTNKQTINPVVIVDATPKTVSVTCTNCTADESSKSVTPGENASFEITADEGYTLELATVSGGCTLNNGVLTLSNVTDDASCSVSAVEITESYVYWSTTEGGSNVVYNSSSKPASAVADYRNLGLTQPAKLIRTTVLGDTVLGHEACIYYNNILFCIPNNYAVPDDPDGTKSRNKLESAMGEVFTSDTITCQIAIDYTTQVFEALNCTISYAEYEKVGFEITPNGLSRSYLTTATNQCRVNAQGDAACKN